MTIARWRPSRAGILIVYQYEDETLHFAGGRFLLRGVNGSGKSTAMNMLLPFLLEANTRKIDAAGEQTGVLRSWMLADTDETQRTGYLWIEFACADPDAPGGLRHHTVGCGIRANRSTHRVTPWWFSTPRRPRIDFSLTAQRIPLAIDALRAELGTDAVFTTPADYRAEIAPVLRRRRPLRLPRPAAPGPQSASRGPDRCRPSPPLAGSSAAGARRGHRRRRPAPGGSRGAPPQTSRP